jgi:hypothetical protein
VWDQFLTKVGENLFRDEEPVLQIVGPQFIITLHHMICQYPKILRFCGTIYPLNVSTLMKEIAVSRRLELNTA